MRNQQSKGQTKNNAFVLGSECFLTGRLVNPFKQNSHLYREWQRGFNTAYFDNLRKVVH